MSKLESGLNLESTLFWSLFASISSNFGMVATVGYSTLSLLQNYFEHSRCHKTSSLFSKKAASLEKLCEASAKYVALTIGTGLCPLISATAILGYFLIVQYGDSIPDTINPLFKSLNASPLTEKDRSDLKKFVKAIGLLASVLFLKTRVLFVVPFYVYVHTIFEIGRALLAYLGDDQLLLIAHKLRGDNP